MPELILASTSVYRQRLLRRLGFTFRSEAPAFDESLAKQTWAQLPAPELCLKLAQAKAQSLARPDTWIVGGDQMLVLKGKIFGKPLSLERAREQLRSLSGQVHELLTSISLQWTDTQGNTREESHINVCRLWMRSLTDSEMEKILQEDQPLDCAGSYKIEARGIALFEKIECEDWTSIEGLPLLWLNQKLQDWKNKLEIAGSEGNSP